MIAFDAVSTATEGSNVSSVTFSHAVGAAGKNRILLTGTITESLDTAVSGVTFNGTALTKIHDAFDPGGGTRVELWYLVNPAATTANIVVTWASSVTRAYAAGVSYTGVHQVHPINISAEETNVGDETSPSISITPTVGNTMLVDVIGASSNTTTLTVGAGQTQRVNSSLSSSDLGMSEKLVVSPAASTMSWSSSVSSRHTMIATALRPVVAGGAFLMNMI